MAAKVRTPAKGTKLQWKATSGGSYATVAGVVGINGPPMRREIVDTTELDEVPATLPGGDVDAMYYRKHKQPGDKEWADITIDVNKNDTMYGVFITAYSQDLTYYWRLVFRGGGSLEFTAFVTEIGNDQQTDQLVKTPITLTPDGEVMIWTPPS